jgi:hypothetical protein
MLPAARASRTALEYGGNDFAMDVCLLFKQGCERNVQKAR